MLTLYDHVESPCCQKVRVLLAEKQLPFDAVWVDIERGENLQPSFLALNPLAQVPVLVHNVDGVENVILESTVICEYLEDYFPEKPIFPAAPAERALARSWAFIVDSGLHMPHTASITFTIGLREPLLAMLDTPEALQAYISSIKHPVNREVRASMLDQGFESQHFHQALESFDELFQKMQLQLEKTPWLAGDNFSYADIVIAPYIKRCLLLDLENMMSPYPRILPWYESVIKRESWQTEVAAKDGEFVARFLAASKGAWQKVQHLISK